MPAFILVYDEGRGEKRLSRIDNEPVRWYTEYKAVEDYFSRLDAVFSCCDEMTENLIIHPVESAWGLSRYGEYVDYFGVTDDEI